MPTVRGRLHLKMVTSLLVTLIAYVALSGWEGNIIRVISGLLLSWFIPGFTLMMLLHPNRTPISIDIIVSSIVTSLILDILVGTILDILNLGLSESGFVIGLWLITVLLLVTGNFTNTLTTISPSQALLNRIRQPPFKSRLASCSEFLKSNYAVILILVSVLLITVSWAFKMNLKAAEVERKPFTALGIELSDIGIPNQYFKITIDNQEGESVIYRLEMRRNSALFMKWENIILDQDKQWAVEIPFSQLIGRSDLWLFREGEVEPYRQVHLVFIR